MYNKIKICRKWNFELYPSQKREREKQKQSNFKNVSSKTPEIATSHKLSQIITFTTCGQTLT